VLDVPTSSSPERIWTIPTTSRIWRSEAPVWAHSSFEMIVSSAVATQT